MEVYIKGYGVMECKTGSDSEVWERKERVVWCGVDEKCKEGKRKGCRKALRHTDGRGPD